MGTSWTDYESKMPVSVLQGDFAVSSNKTEYMSTVLGSCVSVCLHDPITKIGGMNHILLPGDSNSGGGHSRYGVHLMELLINGVLQLGAEKSRLEAKLFGGARIISHQTKVGSRNAEFARDFLQSEGILCVSESVGGNRARKVQFIPSNGLARQMLIDPPADLAARETSVKESVLPKSEVTLF